MFLSMKTTGVIISILFLSFILLSGTVTDKMNKQEQQLKEEVQKKGSGLILYSTKDHILNNKERKKNLKSVYTGDCADTLKSYKNRGSAY